MLTTNLPKATFKIRINFNQYINYCQFVDYDNSKCYHESLNNLTPADVFYGRGDEILKKRREIKLQTITFKKEKILQ